MRCKPALRVFAERLRAKGKRPKVVITAVRRKLLLAWTLLQSGQSCSPTPTTWSSPALDNQDGIRTTPSSPGENVVCNAPVDRVPSMMEK